MKANNLEDYDNLLLIPISGMNIWIKEANFYSRNKCNDTQIAIGNNNLTSKEEYAKGKKLIISLKGFEPHFLGEFLKKDKKNEVTIYFNMNEATKLRDFLNKVIL